MPINVSRPFPWAKGNQPAPVDAPIPQPITNLKDMKDAVVNVLIEQISEFTEGLAPDLQAISNDIAPLLISAASTGDTKLQGELLTQLELIGDIHKIRGNAAFWKGVTNVSNVLLQGLVIGLGAIVKI